MKNVILIRYGEIFLKGKNFAYFEGMLLNNIKDRLKEFDCVVTRMNKRFYVEDYDPKKEKKILQALLEVFGITSISPAVMIESDEEKIKAYVSTLKFDDETFRASVNRADKRFPHTSLEFSSILGGVVLRANSKIKVDLHTPKINLQVDIRENGNSFIYYKVLNGMGGIPVGTSGNGLLLLSGGIDSPVAGYLMAKRGMPISAIHFHSYPYTSIEAKNKVITLGRLISRYTGSYKLYVCSFTEIQEEIHKHCDPDYMITIMRRIMYRIAESLCKKEGIKSIITGENLGQVASQTVESMTVTNAVVKDLPIFRPLIAFDKQEISAIANKIGTFETSILPYEDCCTVFLPKHPVIRPKENRCVREESRLNIGKLIEKALDSIEEIDINPADL